MLTLMAHLHKSKILAAVRSRSRPVTHWTFLPASLLKWRPSSPHWSPSPPHCSWKGWGCHEPWKRQRESGLIIVNWQQWRRSGRRTRLNCGSWTGEDILCSSSDTAHQLDELDILKLEEKHWTGDTCGSQTMDTLRSLDTLDTCQPWLTSPYSSVCVWFQWTWCFSPQHSQPLLLKTKCCWMVRSSSRAVVSRGQRCW